MDEAATPKSRASATTVMVKTSTLVPYFRNPRVGNVPLIVESLRSHGQYKPIIANRGTLTGRPNEVLAGNHLLKGGLEVGLEKMLVHWLDVDDEEAARIVLVDNRASDKGGYDNVLLAELLQDLPSLDATGYSDGDLRRLLNGLELGDQDGLTDGDDVPELPAKSAARTKPGDVWLLGPHRLVCGDAEQLEIYGKLVAGEVIDALWTDPPYGVDYVGKTKDALKIKNDSGDGLAELLHNALTGALTVLRPGAPCYVASPPGPDIVTFYTALDRAGYLARQTLIWVKNTLVLGRSDYQYKHEPVLEAQAPATAEQLLAAANVSRETLPDGAELEPPTHDSIVYGFTPASKGSGRLGRGGDAWFGNNKQTTVFEVPKPAASREHPTMKPLDLIVAMLRNSVARGGTVLDMFAGSGSTLIACHRLALTAYLVEVDPAYCDVIARRYQEHTGTMPILERTGKGVDFIPKAA